MATVKIPTPLRKFTNQQSDIETSGKTIYESIVDVAKQFPEIKIHLFDESERIRSFVRIYLGEEDINVLDKENTAVLQNSIISIIPAIAGGLH